MTQSKKIWLGFLAFLPIIFTIGMIIYMFSSFLPTMIRADQMEGADEEALMVFSTLMPFIIVAILGSLIVLGLIIYFIFHAFSNPAVKTEERIIWILLFIFMSTIAFPVYWIIRIWPNPKPVSNFIRE
jgi:heme/copper-type cytochrome/quinol oxidase subunit 2